MAKIQVEFDTVSKEMSVQIDGKALANVMGIDLCPSYDDPDAYRCVITTVMKDETNDLRSYTQLMACTQPSPTAVPSPDHEGFLTCPVPGPEEKLSRDILAYFGR